MKAACSLLPRSVNFWIARKHVGALGPQTSTRALRGSLRAPGVMLVSAVGSVGLPYCVAVAVGGSSSRNCCTVRSSSMRFFSIRMVCVPSLSTTWRFQAALVSKG